MELLNQRVLVTGATAGIGRETAKLFARRGASLVVTGRDTARGAQTVAVIETELPKMIARGSGAIVNISTMYASVGIADAPAIAAAKAALESLTRSWAAAFGANGIRVNTVAAGPTRTDTAIDMLGDGLEQLGSATPLGRTANPSEIAEAIVFLASPQASYLTGTTVAVDGGYTAI